MVSTNQLPSQEATQSERSLSPRPSPSPSVAGIEYELKDLVLADDGNIANYPPSLDTDSALSAPTASDLELVNRQLESISWILDDNFYPAQTQGLTHLALQTHDLNTRELGYARDLATWCRDDDIYYRADLHADLTESMLANKRTGSRATLYSTSSYDRLNEVDPAADTDHDVSGVGAAFHDIPSLQLEDEAILSLEEMKIEGKDASFLPIADRDPVENANQPGVMGPTGSPDLDENTNQPEGKTSAEPPDLEHEHSDPPKDGTTRSSRHPWIAAIWYWLATMLDPPPEGAYRATYTCGCGELCYIDVEELIPGGAAELEQEIREEAGMVRSRNPGSDHLPHDNVQAPAPAYLPASTLSHDGQQGAPVQGLPNLGEHLQGLNFPDTTTQVTTLDIEAVTQKYLLLCVNTKHGLIKLVHIDVSSHTNDQFLFQEIRNEYKNARRGHDWNITSLLPGRKKIPESVLKLVSIIVPRNIEFPHWIAGAVRDCRIFIPRKVEFVKFELMPVRLEIYAGNIEKPEIPDRDEVQVKKTYLYEPITLKAKILNVPIHQLLKPGQHTSLFWWKRFPKKLDNPLTFDEELDCCGWGILITEGWNRPFVLSLCLLTMIIFGSFVVIYSALTDDASTGAGIGSFVTAILTLYCTLKFEQWKEQ